jgi:tripartite-type tricarboxylate transporter receptor subunit TctC
MRDPARGPGGCGFHRPTGHLGSGAPYPSRPITIIAPYAVGGTTDLIGRIMAERMRAAFGQPVVVENVTGANGTIGVSRVARAPGDG